MLNLYPYQQEGVRFLAGHRRAYLADQYRLGKTPQAIRAAASLFSARLNVEPMITIVCPAVAVPHWQNEWEKWDGPGTPHVLSYDRLIRQQGNLDNPDLTILDEAHYVKSPMAKRTKAALELAQRSERAWLLSATPMPNHPGEWYAPLSYLWPEIPRAVGCASYDCWLKRFNYVRATNFGPKPYAVKNGAELRHLLAPIMLRRTRDEVGIQMPELRVDVQWLPQRKIDTRGLAEYEAQEADEHTYASRLRHLLGRLKAPVIAELIREEIHSGAYRKIVVMYYHRDVGNTLRDYWIRHGLSVAGFDGSTPPENRRAEVARFHHNDTPILLVQQQAGGVAIDLSVADEVVLMEPDWSPDNNSQATGRVLKIGKGRACRARVFAVANTLDAAVMNTCVRKDRAQEQVLGSR